MKTAIKIGISIMALLVTVVPVYACKESTSPPPDRKITLADAPVVLNMSPDLPEGSARLDAASEGLSKEDMGLGSDFSEVEVFLCDEPYQMVFAYLCILESQLERATSDALLGDNEQIEAMVLENLRAGAAEEGIELSEVDVEVSHPDVGDLAVFGSGTMSVYGFGLGYDILIFKVNKVYVFVASVYLLGEKVSLVPVGEGIEQRIGMYSQ